MYEAQKDTIRILINQFCLTDDMLYLVNAMSVGADILESEEFPMKEFAQYKYKFKRYGKKQ